MEYYSPMKKKEILPLATTMVKLEGIIPSEKKTDRKINAVWYHLYVKCKKHKTHRNSSAMVARSSGLREMKRYWSKGINFKS